MRLCFSTHARGHRRPVRRPVASSDPALAAPADGASLVAAPAQSIGRLWRFLLVLGALLCVAPTRARAQQPQKLVRVVYLSPADRAYRPEYRDDLRRATRDLQAWMAGQLGGYTFSTLADPVEWFQTGHAATFYQTNPLAPGFSAGRFWESVLADAFAITGGRFNDPNNRWAFYVDADPLAGQYTGGTSAVALMPANDLRGLNGDPTVAINPGDPTVNPGFNRWVGGLGHELGHAFGLEHPADSPGGPDDNTLLYLGYLTYPDTYLRPSDKSFLLASGFFSAVVPEPSTSALVAAGLAGVGAAVRRRRRAQASAVANAPVVHGA